MALVESCTNKHRHSIIDTVNMRTHLLLALLLLASACSLGPALGQPVAGTKFAQAGGPPDTTGVWTGTVETGPIVSAGSMAWRPRPCLRGSGPTAGVRLQYTLLVQAALTMAVQRQAGVATHLSENCS